MKIITAILLIPGLLLGACAPTKRTTHPFAHETRPPSYAAASSRDDTGPVRFFLQVDGPGSVARALTERSDGQWIGLVEVSLDREVAKDTIRAWVQHLDKGMQLKPVAAHADLIISCYPELLPENLRKLHALPESSGPIYVYNLSHRMVLVTSRRQPVLELVLVPPVAALAEP